MRYPKTYATPDGPVTVHAFSYYKLAGQYCYRIVLSGAIDRFFGSNAVIIDRANRSDNTTIVAYQPGDDTPEYQFVRDHAARLDELGEWPKEDHEVLA